MRKSKREFLPAKTILLVLLISLSFVSCNKSVQKQEEINKEYCTSFLELYKQNPKDPQLEKMLNKWKKKAPLGDFYKCSYFYYYDQSLTLEDNSNIVFPEGHTCINDGTTLKYKDASIDIATLNKAIDFLYNGLEKYPTRIDLWDKLVYVLREMTTLDNLTDALLDFIDNVEYGKINNLKWYMDFNEPVQNMETEKSYEQFLYGFVKTNALYILQSEKYEKAQAYKSCEKIFRRVIEVFPENSDAYNELGFCMAKREDALPFYEKAYELDNSNKVAATNAAITSYILKDTKKSDKYMKIIYDSGDEEEIKYLEDYIKWADGIK